MGSLDTLFGGVPINGKQEDNNNAKKVDKGKGTLSFLYEDDNNDINITTTKITPMENIKVLKLSKKDEDNKTKLLEEKNSLDLTKTKGVVREEEINEEIKAIIEKSISKLDKEIQDFIKKNRFQIESSSNKIENTPNIKLKRANNTDNPTFLGSKNAAKIGENDRLEENYSPYLNTEKKEPKQEVVNNNAKQEEFLLRDRLEKYSDYLKIKGLNTEKGGELLLLMKQMKDILDLNIALAGNLNFKKLFYKVEGHIYKISKANGKSYLETINFTNIKDEYNKIIEDSKEEIKKLGHKIDLEKGFIEPNKNLYFKEELEKLKLDPNEDLDFDNYAWYSLFMPSLNEARDEIGKIKENIYNTKELIEKGEKMDFELDVQWLATGSWPDSFTGANAENTKFENFQTLINQANDPDVKAYLENYHKEFIDDLKEAKTTFEELKKRLNEIKGYYNQAIPEEKEGLDEEIKGIVSYMTLINGLDNDSIMAPFGNAGEWILDKSGIGILHDIVSPYNGPIAAILMAGFIVSATLKPGIEFVKKSKFERELNKEFKGEKGIDKNKLEELFKDLTKEQKNKNIDSLITKGKIDYNKLTIYELEKVLEEVKGENSPEVKNLKKLQKLVENKKALGDEFIAKKLEKLKMKALNSNKVFSRDILIELFRLKSFSKTALIKFFEGDITLNIRNLLGSRVTGGVFSGDNIAFADSKNADKQLEKIINFETSIIKETDNLKGLMGIKNYDITNEKIPKIEGELNKLKLKLTNKYAFVANKIVDDISDKFFVDIKQKDKIIKEITEVLYEKEGLKIKDKKIKKGLKGEEKIRDILNEYLKKGKKIKKDKFLDTFKNDKFKINEYEKDFIKLQKDIEGNSSLLREKIIIELNEKLDITVLTDIKDSELEIGKSDYTEIKKLKIEPTKLKSAIVKDLAKLDNTEYSGQDKLLKDIAPQNLKTVKDSLEKIVLIEKEIAKGFQDDLKEEVRGVLKGIYNNIKINASNTTEIEFDVRLDELLDKDGEINKIKGVLGTIDGRKEFNAEFKDDIIEKIKKGINDTGKVKIDNISTNIDGALELFETVEGKGKDNIIKQQVIKGIKDKIIFPKNQFDNFGKIIKKMSALEPTIEDFKDKKASFEKAVKEIDGNALNKIEKDILNELEIEKLKLEAKSNNSGNFGNNNNGGGGNNGNTNSGNGGNNGGGGKYTDADLKIIERLAKVEGMIEGLEKAGVFQKESKEGVVINNNIHTEANVNSKNTNNIFTGYKTEDVKNNFKHNYTDTIPKDKQLENKPIEIENKNKLKQIELKETNYNKNIDLLDRLVIQLETELKFDDVNIIKGYLSTKEAHIELGEIEPKELEAKYKHGYNIEEIKSMEELKKIHRRGLKKLNIKAGEMGISFDKNAKIKDVYNKIVLKDTKLKGISIDDLFESVRSIK